MKIINPIWYEGTLLLPQIFQQQEWAQQQHSLSINRLTRITFWGVVRVQPDLASLALNKLKLTDCAVSFQDGSWFDAKEMQYLPPARDLNQIGADIIDTTVYLTLPELNSTGSNLVENNANTPLRFTRQFTEVADLYGQQRTEIAAKEFNFSLKFEHENRQNDLAIPLLKLSKSINDEWQINDSFVPPVLFIESNHYLTNLLNRQIQLLQNKSHRLAALRKERTRQSADFLVSDVSLFWLLNILNQSLPELQLLQRFPNVAPENYYRLLSRLVGSLLSFSFEMDIDDIPPYEPLDLYQTFSQLDHQLMQLLDTVIPTVLVVIELEKSGLTRWTGHLHDHRLDENADYYLSVRANTPLYQLQDRFPKLCKIGSPDDIERILPSASNGIGLRMMQRLPSALPMRSEAIYFALDKSHPHFTAMIQSGSCCIYVPDAFENLNLELYVVPNEQ
ncbi:type VI secretion system baseplate subunit TssK [Neisseriaceae bacterium ESL0693]|nr:type VI secretion system baseplate subunit TssK [Neisseriaceae bacterium ESL0693]